VIELADWPITDDMIIFVARHNSASAQLGQFSTAPKEFSGAAA